MRTNINVIVANVNVFGYGQDRVVVSSSFDTCATLRSIWKRGTPANVPAVGPSALSARGPLPRPWLARLVWPDSF